MVPITSKKRLPKECNLPRMTTFRCMTASRVSKIAANKARTPNIRVLTVNSFGEPMFAIPRSYSDSVILNVEVSNERKSEREEEPKTFE